jgi:hypothetical protein
LDSGGDVGLKRPDLVSCGWGIEGMSEGKRAPSAGASVSRDGTLCPTQG